MKLYITRHGETSWNAENKVLGATDIPLNEMGKAQAAALAEKLRDVDVDIIFASPLSRAKETAEAIAVVKGMPIILDSRLMEMNAGDLEGAPRGGDEYQTAKREHFKRYPNGESFFDAAYRIYDFLYEIKGKYPDKKVLLVSHGGVCRIICNFFKDMDNEEFVTHAFPNCGFEEFDF